jgi:hypothetical protein
MKRPLEVVSGIGVLVTSVIGPVQNAFLLSTKGPERAAYLNHLTWFDRIRDSSMR